MRAANDNKTLDWIEEIGVAKYEHKFTHGTVYAYNKHKCRCEFCKEAKSISNQRAALKKAVVAQGVMV
ncbi:hypothetical protein EXE30_06745 [Acinetobacter halotolerans]|uniref:Uncharacterized protein n=1 Tax=Acinetobacter halotolerans TaxID=1752076 RepID=A0A4Q6XGV1_9GAMM|nr:hypothetical protein [Acinetobacter halotolerans]RZF53667.1 hypothetical protein EXE30_06745 [Acinetobacter halotolerans]